MPRPLLCAFACLLHNRAYRAGVEIVNIKDSPFDVPAVLDGFVHSKGELLACGTCLSFRHQQGGVCPVSTMSQLVDLISESDKLVTLG